MATWGPLQLHPGDLGWYSLRGPAATAAATRVWPQGHAVLAVASVEQLAQNGWSPDEPWTPLHHELDPDMAASPVAPGFRIEVVEPDDTAEWAAVHWSAFRGIPVPEERIQRFVDGWRLVAESPFLDLAHILSLRNRNGRVVAAVWSAGGGRPGLIEPLAVHQEHRGRGYGTVMTKAAMDALRHMGSSSAVVCAETTNAGAVATYQAAGFTAHPEVADRHRGA